MEILPIFFQWAHFSCQAFNRLTDETIVRLKDKIIKLRANNDIYGESALEPRMKERLAGDRWTDKDKWHQNHILNAVPFSHQGWQRKTTYPASDETNVAGEPQIPAMSQLYLAGFAKPRRFVTSTWHHMSAGTKWRSAPVRHLTVAAAFSRMLLIDTVWRSVDLGRNDVRPARRRTASCCMTVAKYYPKLLSGVEMWSGDMGLLYLVGGFPSRTKTHVRCPLHDMTHMPWHLVSVGHIVRGSAVTWLERGT